MWSQIESELKKSNSHKMQSGLRESLKHGAKTGPKSVPNRIFDAEALEKPLESSWTLLERSWSALGRSYNTLGAENTPT